MAEPTPEHKTFRVLQHWQPLNKILSAEELMASSSPFFPLFSSIYTITQEMYATLPKRKNGENPLVHPCNLVMFLNKAKNTDEIITCAGMLHDVVEEKVDVYKRKNNINRTEESLKKLDKYETEVFNELEQELTLISRKHTLPSDTVPNILSILRLLTRHKRHYYYKSISSIFECKDPYIKEAAISIKLADRTHNILCIECFTEQERLYQCFKNLFILNNVKKYLIDTYGQEEYLNMKFYPVEKLFNKCCKATYDAFIRICSLTQQKELEPIKTLLQMAFKKYALATHGLWEVTTLNPNETHLTRLYQGVVRKYDARLLHQAEKFESIIADEKAYCRKFFVDYNFTEEQIEAILDYKDAYALKEVIASLLYNVDYTIGGFLATDLKVGKTGN